MAVAVANTAKMTVLLCQARYVFTKKTLYLHFAEAVVTVAHRKETLTQILNKEREKPFEKFVIAIGLLETI